jgi:hypothetical protein
MGFSIWLVGIKAVERVKDAPAVITDCFNFVSREL